MKKKLILMLSIMAIAVCMFALTVSADSFICLPELEDDQFIGSLSYDGDIISNNIDSGHTIVEDIEFKFGFTFFSCEIKSIQDPYASQSTTFHGAIVYNPENFYNFVQSHDITDYSEFASSLDYLITDELIPLTDETDVTGLRRPDSLLYDSWTGRMENMWSAYEAYTIERNIPTYEEGLIEGKAEGIEYFKTSTEYETTLNNKYVLGQKEGVANYLKSDDYTKALDAEYDAGYNQGVSDTESTSSSSGTGALFSVLAIVLVVLAGFYIYKSVSRKRGR